MESCELETLRHQVNMLKENFIQQKRLADAKREYSLMLS